MRKSAQRGLAVVSLVLLAAAGCYAIGHTDAENGTYCTKDFECESGMQCVQNACQPIIPILQGSTTPDAGNGDSGDTGAPPDDTGTVVDTGPNDTGSVVDTGPDDTGKPDTGAPDTGSPDTGSDTGDVDSGTGDAPTDG